MFYSQFLIRSQASSKVRRGEIVGYHAEVTIPIGEKAPGQVSYTTKAGRMSSMACSADGEAIANGELVEIVRVEVIAKQKQIEVQEQEVLRAFALLVDSPAALGRGALQLLRFREATAIRHQIQTSDPDLTDLRESGILVYKYTRTRVCNQWCCVAGSRLQGVCHA